MITEEKRSTAGHQDAVFVQTIYRANDLRLSDFSPTSPPMPFQVWSRTESTSDEYGSVHCKTLDDFYFLLRLMFTYNQGAPGTIGDFLFLQQRVAQTHGHAGERYSVKEISDPDEYIQVGLHLLLFYIEVLLVVYRGEHRVEHFEFIRELVNGNLDFGKLSLTGEEWDLECSTLVTSYLSQAVNILDIDAINDPPFTFCIGALSISKKWLDLWSNLPEDERREMMTRIMLFHYLEGIASEHHQIFTDLAPIVPSIIATKDTKQKFRVRTEGLSKRAKQLLQAGELFVTEGTFDEILATKDYEMSHKIIPFLMHINGFLLQKKLPWFSSGIEIVMTRAGTAGSFGGLFNNLIRVTQGDSGNAYGVSEPATYTPQLLRNGSVSTWCKLIVNRLAPDGGGGIKELGMLEIVARILEENIQLFFHPLSLTIWKEKFGFSLEELIAEKVLESIKLGELNEKLSGVTEFAEISQEISCAITRGKQSLADLIPSEAKTVPSGYATLKRIFGPVLQQAIDSNLLLDYLFCDKFSELMDIQLNGYTGNYEGIRKFASELLESVVAGSCSPDSEQVLNVESLTGCSVPELLQDIGFVADYGSQQSTEVQITCMSILATQILHELEAKQHTDSAPQNPFLEAVLYVAPRRIQKVFLADTIASTIA